MIAPARSIVADRPPVSRRRADPGRRRRRGHPAGHGGGRPAGAWSSSAATRRRCAGPRSPSPAGGYQLSDAREFLGVVRAGWQDGSRLTWAVEAERDGVRQYCGAISLRLSRRGWAEIGFVLHPGARGRSRDEHRRPAGPRLRLRRAGADHPALAGRAGNWASRRVAAAAGFVFDGSVRRLLEHAAKLVDGWLATMTATTRVRRSAGWSPSSWPAREWTAAVRRVRRRAHHRGLLRRRGPGTGWSRCPIPTDAPTR